MKRYIHFIAVCLFLILSQQGMAQSITNTRTQASYATIQNAVNGASSGDTLTVAAGSYIVSGRITVNKSISLLGQDETTTIIDASANGTDYGILISSSNVTLSNFTIKPPLGPGALGTSTGGGYAIHVSNTPSILNNVTITHVTVKNGNRSGIDINGTDHAVISYVTTQNAAYGNGMNITGVHGANVSHITTGGNAWGGIAVYVSIPSQANRGSDSIIIDATTCNIPETNKVYAQNESGLTNTNVTVAGYDYVAKNSSAAFSGYTWYQDNVANAVAYSNLINSSSPGSYVSQLSSGTFYVGSGMSIQPAINAASAGGIIRVFAGTFNESIAINKLVALQGAGSDPAGTILQSTLNPTLVNTSPYSYKPVVRVSASGTDGNPITIKDLMIRPRQDLVSGQIPAILLSSGQSSFLTLDNVRIVGTRSGGTAESGLTVGDSASLDHLTITNCEFKNMAYGMIFYKNLNNSSTVANVLVNNTIIDSNSIKGFYAEKLSDASFSSLTVVNNGDTTLSPSWADPNNAGIDINLKFGAYQNLSFNNLAATGNGVGSGNGAGLAIKARGTGNDPLSYRINPATLTGVTITGGTLEGNSTGIRFGEPGNSNTSPTNVTISQANITANIQFDISSALSGVAVTATGNWWGTAVIPTIQSKISGNVVVSPYYVNSTMTILNNVPSASVFVDAAYTDGNAAGHVFGYDAFSKIQDGVGAVATGGDVHVAAGIYDETININKRITLAGAGTGNTGTILKNSAAQGDFAKLPLVAGVTYGGYRPNVIISASGMNSNKSLLLKDLQIEPGPNDGYPRPAILLQPGPAGAGYVASYSYVELDNIRVIGDVSGDTPGQADPHVLPVSSNTRGITIDGSTSLMHCTITNCEFSDMTYGMIFYNNASNPSTVEDIEISNTTFARNSVKGFYAEKLSDATFTNVAVINNGNINHSPYYWAWNNAGIDITLQYGSYENLVFNNLTVNGNGIGSYAGAGLTVKARGTGNDDPALRATLNGVTVNGGTFSGNTVGIRFGEVNNPSAPTYWNPPAQSMLNTSPTNVTVNNASISANRQYGISNLLSGIRIAAEGNWWGAASGPQNTTTNPSGHGDTLNSNVDYAPWWDRDYNGVAPPWAWSTNGDLLSAINTVSHGDTLNFLGSNSGKLNSSKNVIVKFATPPVLDSVNVTNGDLVLSSSITVSGNLNLSNGNIITKDSNKIVFDTSAVIPTETQHGAIIGTVEVVPRNVGTGSLNLLGLSIGSGNDNLEKVGVIRKSGNDAAVTISDNVGIATTWTIEADHQPSSGREVVFSWLPDFDNNVDTTQIVVYRNSGSGWRQFAGPFRVSGVPRQVTVNATGFSNWTLGSISSTPLVPRLNFTSRSITFPTVKLGQWKDTVITISNNGNDTLKITTITSTKNYFSARPALFIVPPGASKNDTIRFVSDSIGVRNAVITFVNNAATSPDIISVTGFGSGTPIMALPSRSITFPAMNIGQWVDTVLAISNTGNDTLKITGITSTRSNVSFRPAVLTIAPHETKNDTMRFVSDLFGARNVLVSIASNAATNPDMINVEGFGIGTPVLSVNPRRITFPAARVGQWKDTVITISNTGNDILDITNIISTRSYFSIRPTILSILPGETSSDTIRFMPDSIGLRTASVSFATNAPASYDIIYMTGFGIGTPGLTLNSRSLIFPATKIGQWMDTVVTVTNNGNDSLKISIVASNKNYFNIRLTDLIVPPGETRNDTVRFMPDSIGSRNGLITFLSNAATSPDTIIITGFGIGTSGFALNPRSITFPTVKLGQWRDTVVTITNNGNDTLKITSITTTKDIFSIRPTVLFVPPGGTRKDTLRFVPDSIGVKTSFISFLSNAATSPDTIAVTGFGLGTPKSVLNPRTIAFPKVKIAQWKDTVVVVTNTGTDTLKITNITSTRSYFSIRPTVLTVPPGGTRNDTLRFIPDSIGVRSALISFVSNAAASPDTVAVTGLGLGTPQLVLNTRNITFPIIKIGQWKDTVLTITNTGSDTLRITSISSTKSTFSIRPTIFIISPGGMRNDTIRFTSDSTGIRKAFISFLSNADTSPDTVMVSGNGTTTGIAQVGPEIPESFELFQNYPNPFNPTTTIKFKLPGPGTRYLVSLRVYDILGREVATLLSEELPAGNYVQQWNAQNLSSGIYFYRLDAQKLHDEQTGSFTQTKELVLIK